MEWKEFRVSLVLALMVTVIPFQFGFAYTIGSKEVKKGIWKGEEIEYVSGQILLKPKSGVALNEFREFLIDEGYTIVEEFDKLKIGMVEIPEGVDLFKKIGSLNKNP